MASAALTAVQNRFADIDDILMVYADHLPGRSRGPKQQRGPAVLRSGLVVLVAAIEGFLEDLYEEAVDFLYPDLATVDRKKLLKNTSDRFHQPSADKVDALYQNLGVPFIMAQMRWPRFSNSQVRAKYERLIHLRGSIAHGGRPSVRPHVLKNYRVFAERFARTFERRLKTALERRRPGAPAW